MKKLDGWQRLGLVLSAIWFAGVIALAAYEYFSLHSRGFFVTFSATAFLDGKEEPALQTGRFFMWLLVPPLVAWVVACIGVWVIKWVTRGFRG